ncbi:MAG: hypothetical protein KGH75_08305 [Rhodospirillales bacterium]|nr:hypothetical protein [Rhodospirillales bacterium]
MPHEVRQRLVPYLYRIAGSCSAEHEDARLRILVLAAARIFAPIALDAAGMREQANKMRSISDTASYSEIRVAACEAESAAVYAERAAANAADATANAAARATYAAGAAADAYAWDEYFKVLDTVLNAGPQGEPWSADVVAQGVRLFEEAAR